jgi:hypothetical protein
MELKSWLMLSTKTSIRCGALRFGVLKRCNILDPIDILLTGRDKESESDAGTHRTPKALRAKLAGELFLFCASFGSAHIQPACVRASSRRFSSVS